VIAAIQTTFSGNAEGALLKACELIQEAAENGAQLVVLPEEFVTLGLSEEDKQQVWEFFGEGSIQQRLQKMALNHQIWIVAGTLPIKTQGEAKVTSSTLVFNAEGLCVARYDKMHLFDVNVGTEDYSESKWVKPGKDIVVLDSPVGKLGLAVCYDLRFPELFRAMMKKGAQVFLLPSAFTEATGKVHWEILLKARAIENLAYMVAPNHAGIRLNGRKAYGHSMIIDPWGATLASAKTSAEILYTKIDLDHLNHIRQQFPALSHIQHGYY
jgi:nitrilase